MLSQELVDSTTLLLVLLNPFLLCIYLLDLIQGLDRPTFAKTMTRAGLISAAVYFGFAIAGDRPFTYAFKVRYESFLIFGGIVFPGAMRTQPIHQAQSIDGSQGQQGDY